MLVRRKKYLSIVLLGIALFVISFTVQKSEFSNARINDKTQENTLTTTTLIETFQDLSSVENRGKLRQEAKEQEITHQNYSKLLQNSVKAVRLSDKNSDKTFLNQGFQQDRRKHSDKGDAQIKKRFPTVIILGVKKAGTRALLEILQMHPNVIAAPNEVYFFNGFHAKGLEWYREQMPFSLPDQITVEKSPTYFTSFEKTQVVNRMFVFSRSSIEPLKLLVVVRDPTKRSLSDYTDILARIQKKEIPPIAEDFENLILHKNGSVNTNSSIVKTGLYIKHLKEWLQYFPPNEIHFVSGEGLVRTPYKEIKEVEKFLDLKPFFSEKNFWFNKMKGFPCFVPNPSRSNVSKCLPGNKGRKHVKVNQRTLEHLRQFYRPYNEEFYRAVKRNFYWS